MQKSSLLRSREKNEMSPRKTQIRLTRSVQHKDHVLAKGPTSSQATHHYSYYPVLWLGSFFLLLSWTCLGFLFSKSSDHELLVECDLKSRVSNL